MSNDQLTKVYFVFSNTNMNENIPDEVFHFDFKKNPNVQIIDEREKTTMNK